MNKSKKSKKSAPAVEAVSVDAEIAALMGSELAPAELEALPADDVQPVEAAPVVMLPLTVDDAREALRERLTAYSDGLKSRNEPNTHVPAMFQHITGVASNLCALIDKGLLTPDDARSVIARIYKGHDVRERLAQKAIVKLFGTIRALATDTPDAQNVSNLHGLYSLILARSQSIRTTGADGMIAKLSGLATVEANTSDTQSSSSAHALFALGVLDVLDVDAKGRVQTHTIGTRPIAGAFAALYAGASVSLFPKGRRA